jgi:hypothetical protein
MANFSALIPVAQAATLNTRLETEGFGPTNFSVPVLTGAAITHAVLHCWPNPAFRAALQAAKGAFPDLVIRDGDNLKDDTQAWIVGQGEVWNQPTGAKDAYMKGDSVVVDGRTWISLMDYNVWPVGVAGWREVVAQGYPAWVQPTGAHDAYKLGDKVAFNGKNYESTINANVWSPAVYPAGWKVIA